MIVTDDLASGIELLGCRKVGRLSISKIAVLHALDIQCCVERLVHPEVLSIRGRCEFTRRHSGHSRYITHRNWITRPGLILQAIRDSLPVADIDEVVVGGVGCGRASRGIV